MRIACPLCGARDLREFTYRGAALLLDRPGAEAGPEAMDAYLHLRDNPAGPNAELWRHAFGCRAWLHVVRDTRDHAILSVELARDVARGAARQPVFEAAASGRDATQAPDEASRASAPSSAAGSEGGGGA